MNRALLIILGVVLTLGVSGLLITTLQILLLVFAGVLFGIFLGGLSRWVASHTPLPYLAAYGGIVIALVGSAMGVVAYAGAQIAQQAARLSQELRTAGGRLLESIEQYEWMPAQDQLAGMVTSGSSQILPQVSNALHAFTWGITGIVVVFFVGLYMAFDPQLYANGLVTLFPPEKQPKVTEILEQLRSALGRWIVGRLISMAIIGIATSVGLMILGVPLAIPLGVLAALLTFIPNIGPILAAVPQALLAFNVSTDTVLWVLLLNFALQGMESYLVTPIVQRYVVTLPPALTIAVQLLFTATLGLVGVMMAAPITVAVMEMVRLTYLNDRRT